MPAAFLPKNLFDLSICFYTDDDTELERCLARDTAVRGRDMNGVAAMHTIRWQQYDHYYKVYQDKADVLINQTGKGFRIEQISNRLGK
ncbi:uridine/cytidine kinase [Streptococcus intermedius]|nr:uridine/cytidine kinase [Streptococcus intermedius]